jgi:DNA (cytosine-5)-methyltransferase 1
LISFKGGSVIRFVDLFAGIGGIRLGFQQALAGLGIGSECVLASEIDVRAQETYELNFGEKPEGDIYQIKTLPQFDFLLAGFPCQPFSYAGKQKGFGDTRGTLFFEIERILGQHQPNGFLLENVRGLTTHDGGRTFQTILKKLEDLGYGVNWLLLNSSDFGVPQNRVRVYIVGVKNSKPVVTLRSNKGAADSHRYKKDRIERDLFDRREAMVVRDILEPNPAKHYDCTATFSKKVQAHVVEKRIPLDGVRLIDFRNGNSLHSWELGIKGDCSEDEIAFMNALIANRRKKVFGAHQDGKSLSIEQIGSFYSHPKVRETIKSLLEKKYLRERNNLFNPVSGNMSFEVFKFLDPDSISITLVSSDAHKLGVKHNGRLRRITPRECARLQGYPDSFVVHPTDLFAYKQFGNSVSVPVINAVVRDFFEGTSGLQPPPISAHRSEPSELAKKNPSNRNSENLNFKLGEDFFHPLPENEIALWNGNK